MCSTFESLETALSRIPKNGFACVPGANALVCVLSDPLEALLILGVLELACFKKASCSVSTIQISLVFLVLDCAILFRLGLRDDVVEAVADIDLCSFCRSLLVIMVPNGLLFVFEEAIKSISWLVDSNR